MSGFFSEWSDTADSILGFAERGASVYERFAGTGGNRNDGSLPVVAPPVSAAPSGMSTTTIVALVAGAVLIGYFLLRRK